MTTRITLKKIKSNPWFLKNLTRELIEASHAAYYRKANPTFSPQTVDETMKIAEEARVPRPVLHLHNRYGWGNYDEDDNDDKEDGESRD
ncbi:SNF1-related protein kinase 2.10 [Artemisia annua]|uniref:SNF1-related protein kinase 2.10 n=1 Tax=Artemisia annua TaxID=35608 RepID=A0A2U1MWC4_ARTAN|nr:SNF1-related protein kinase 2.10 [Artemisia annua]